MQAIKNIMKTDWLVALVIVLFGLTSFVGVVIADEATTSVTVGNATPTLSVTFNNQAGTPSGDITLTEDTFTWATTTVEVTDSNGCSDINAVSAKFIIASSTGFDFTNENCAEDDNYCYHSNTSTSTAAGCVATTTGNTCAGGADTSVEYDCAFKLWYIAEATDAGAPIWASSIWSVAATATDATGDAGTATNTDDTVEVTTLNALKVTSAIAYGSVGAGSDTGSTNQSAFATTTGNIAIDVDISGTVMTGPGTDIAIANQEYSTSAFTYGAGTDLSGGASNLELTNANPSATTSQEADETFWGIGIDAGQTPGAYSGTNTFTAVAD